MSIRALSGSGLSPASPVGNAYASSLTLSGGVVKNPYTGTGVTITIGTVNGAGPYTSTITLTGTNPAWTSAMVANAVLQATAGTGSLGTGIVTVTSVVSSTSVNISSTAAMTAGTITDLLIVSYGTGVFSAPASLTANTTLSNGLTVNGSGGLIVSSGNVGIGTSSPANMLHIAGETAQFPTSIYIAPTGHATSDRAGLAIDNWEWMQDTGGSGTKDFALYQRSANTTRLNISTSGNVGIGTSSPSATLHVTGTVAGAVSPRAFIPASSFTSSTATLSTEANSSQFQWTFANTNTAYIYLVTPSNFNATSSCSFTFSASTPASLSLSYSTTSGGTYTTFTSGTTTLSTSTGYYFKVTASGATTLYGLSIIFGG